jgi:hypothetical protein
MKEGNAEYDVCGVSVCPSPQLPHLQDVVSGGITPEQELLTTQQKPLETIEDGKKFQRKKHDATNYK